MDQDTLIRRLGTLIGADMAFIGAAYACSATFLAMLALDYRQRSVAGIDGGWIAVSQIVLLAIALGAWGRSSASLSAQPWMPTAAINRHTKTQIAGGLVMWLVLLAGAVYVVSNLVFPELTADRFHDTTLSIAGSRGSRDFQPYATHPKMWGLAAFSFAIVFVSLAVSVSMVLIRWQQRRMDSESR